MMKALQVLREYSSEGITDIQHTDKTTLFVNHDDSYIRINDNNIIEFLDENDNVIFFYEPVNRYWCKREYDTNGNLLLYCDSNDTYNIYQYDHNGNIIMEETNNGQWSKWVYDHDGNNTYYTNYLGSWTVSIYDHNSNIIFYNNHKNETAKWTYNHDGSYTVHRNLKGIKSTTEYTKEGQAL